MSKNDRLLRALFRKPVDRTPIWIMRQAGRYLPEYRQTRARAGSFLKLCKTPELACEVSLQPIQRFDLDAVILFSDILTIPDAMDFDLTFIEQEGPVFNTPFRNKKQLSQIRHFDLARLNYVYETIGLIKHELQEKVPVIGFAGSPWTVSAYMIDGKSKTGFEMTLKMLQEDPILLHNLLDSLADAISAHLNAQIVAGAQIVMLFDTWGGLLNSPQFEEFSLFYIQKIIALLKRDHNNSRIPVILFTKGGAPYLEAIAASGCDAVGLDFNISLKEAKNRIGDQVALQGNMNPADLLLTPKEIEAKVDEILAQFGEGSGHVFNLGHGITPNVHPEHVSVLVNAVHEKSKFYHNGL